MPGIKQGGVKTAATNKAKDPDFYSKLGKKGGSAERPESRPFHKNRELAREAGRKGGLVTGDQYKTRSKDATV